MPSEFVTIKKTDRRFEELVTGRFSKNKVARPTDSFNLDNQLESMTFEVVPRSEIKTPNKLVVIWKGLRPSLITITLSPVILALTILSAKGEALNVAVAISSVAALMFLHFAAFLLNDYYDHLKGVDQTNRKRGSRIIQNGWIPAWEVKTWGLVNVGLGVVAGIPALLSDPLLIGGLGVFALMTVIGFSRAKKGFKETGLGEFLIFLCLGPLLTIGFSTAVADKAPPSVWMIGFVFGWMASLIFQIRHLEDLVTTAQNRQGNLIHRLGFDRAKKVISSELWILGASALLSAPFTVGTDLVALPVIGLLYFISTMSVIRRLRRARSSMDSQLVGLSSHMAWSHLQLAVLTFIFLAPRSWLFLSI